MKQPLGIVALLYVGGLLLGNYFQPPLPCLFALSLAVVAVALLLTRFCQYLIWPLIVLTGWTNFVWHTAIASPIDLRALLASEPALITVRGSLAETPTLQVLENSYYTTARLDVTAIRRGTNWQPALGRIVVKGRTTLPEDFFAGQNVTVYGVIASPPRPLADGLFDAYNYFRRQEIYFQLETESESDWQLVEPRKTSPPLSDRFRRWAKGALALGRAQEDAPLRLEQALTLGDKTYLTKRVTEPFVRAATYHIFAVDGLRMAIIFGMFFALFRAMRVPRLICGLVLIPLIWFYVALTGWPASAIRATVMLTIVIVGWILKRPGNVLNSLFAAALIILIWQPQQLFQAGFQLSFLVVLCIILVMPVFDGFVQRLLKPDPLLPEELRPRWQRLLHTPLRFTLDLFFTSLAAWVGSIPLVASYFHIFTPISTPANVLAVPLCMLVLGSNLISLLLAGWFPAGAAIFNHFGWLFMEWIRATSVWFANLPYAYCYVVKPSLFTTSLYYLIFLAVVTGWLFKAKWRVWKLSAIALLLIVWVGLWIRERSTVQLTALPLDGGSAVFCNLPGKNNNLLVDCGDTNQVERVTSPFLQAQGVNSLRHVALTHGDIQRVGGATVLNVLIPIDKLVTSSARFRSPTYQRVVGALEKTLGPRSVLNFGNQLDNWMVLHPTGTNNFPQADDNALVLSGEFYGTRILLLSDLGKRGQQALLERNSYLQADIVIAGLPQQGEPLSDSLLDAIKPRLIVITDSKLPATRTASRALRERLKKRGVPVIYTSDLGAVKISIKQNGWEVNASDGDELPIGSLHR